MTDTNASAAPLAHTINAATQRLGIGRTTMYELIGRGEIKTILIGSRRLVPECELQRIVKERMQVAA
jgi:excisionase family DNA binding protein